MKAELDAIADLITRCHLCRLSKKRTKAVPGRGTPNTPVMLVGEAPGAKENKAGLPFVGDAGRVLKELLAVASLNGDLNNEDVFITNIVKCRPPGNRDPEDNEKTACTPYLSAQLNMIQPRVIVAMGGPAAQSILDTTESISSLRGKPVRWGPYTVLPTFHPSYGARNVVGAMDLLRADFRLIPRLLTGELVPETEAEFVSDPDPIDAAFLSDHKNALKAALEDEDQS